MEQTGNPLNVAYMQNRELSWLDFNKRVLDQGADETVPLLERLNFISIFWSTLQEFHSHTLSLMHCVKFIANHPDLKSVEA